MITLMVELQPRAVVARSTYRIYAITPIDHTSTAFPYGFLRSTSGAIANIEK